MLLNSWQVMKEFFFFKSFYNILALDIFIFILNTFLLELFVPPMVHEEFRKIVSLIQSKWLKIFAKSFIYTRTCHMIKKMREIKLYENNSCSRKKALKLMSKSIKQKDTNLTFVPSAKEIGFRISKKKYFTTICCYRNENLSSYFNFNKNYWD